MGPPDQIEKIRVVNRNDFAISDRYDGIPWVFRPNEPVDVPPEVARHILGYPGDTEDMFRHMGRRWGWNLPRHMEEDSKGVPLWWRQCQRIEISVEVFEMRRVTDSRAPIRADDDGEEQMRPANDTPTIAERRKARKDRNTYRAHRSPEQRAKLSEQMKGRWAAKHAARAEQTARLAAQQQSVTEPVQQTEPEGA